MNVTDMLRNWCQVCDDELSDECILADHGPVLVDADFEWRICDRCRGEGTLGGYPGWYTSDDFAEDPDLFEGYMEHRRRCEPDWTDERGCGGSGKVLELTEAAAARPIVQQWFQEEAEYRAEVAAERRMGA